VARWAGGGRWGHVYKFGEKFLRGWDITRPPPIFLAMTGRESNENIAALEPDIVGEHFVLSRLAQRNLSTANRARLCELAWQLGPLGMEQFALRVMYDFRASNPRATRAFLADIRSVAAKRNEPALWDLWTQAAADSLGWDILSLIRNSAMCQVNEEGRFFPENPLVTRDRAGALALLAELRQVAAEHDDASLSKTWTYAALGM